MQRNLSATLAVLLVFAAAHPSRADKPASKEKKEVTVRKLEGDPAIPAEKARPAVKLSKSELRLVNAVNEYRRKRDLEPLKVDATLMCVARRSAPHFSHVVNGKWCWQRCRRAGFKGWASDDIANGYMTPEDAVDGWATSDGHARQMRGYFKMNGRWCNYKFNRIGVGISGRKYIAIFGREAEKPKES